MPRPRLPSKVLELRGSFVKNPQRKRPLEPQPAVQVPACPSHLDRTAKREWRRITPELKKLGLLSHLDRAALAAYCQCWAEWVSAEQHLQVDGYVLTTPAGQQRINRWFSIGHR